VSRIDDQGRPVWFENIPTPSYVGDSPRLIGLANGDVLALSTGASGKKGQLLATELGH
jgi:hypothetical protein